MPIVSNQYEAPTWVNDSSPPIDADELQAMCDSIVANQTGIETLEANIANLWVWEKYPATAAYAKHSEPSTSNRNLFRNGVSGTGSGYYVRYKASTSVSVEDDGTITLDDPSIVTVYKPSNSTGAGYPDLVGKYFQYYDSSSSSQTCDFQTGIFYCPADATFTATGSSYITVTGIETITGISAENASREQGLIGYLCNNDSSAYPANGKSGDYWYIRSGQIGGAAFIETGAYVGTGTYGSENPNSLTFQSPPKCVIVEIGATTSSYNFTPHIVWVSPSPTAPNGATATSGSAGSNLKVNTSVSGSTFSWCGDSAQRQLNESGKTYYYIAFA